MPKLLLQLAIFLNKWMLCLIYSNVLHILGFNLLKIQTVQLFEMNVLSKISALLAVIPNSLSVFLLHYNHLSKYIQKEKEK